MCRLTAYLGPPVTLAGLLVDPPGGLLRQSWSPRRQRHGVVNADGFGVGWYEPSRRPEPARYRSPRPMWADASFASLAGVVASGAVLAAVRSATPPLAVEESATPPFTEGRWLFAHNGAVPGFRDGTGSRLRRSLSERRDAGIAGPTDSEVLFAMVLDRLDAGSPPGDALTATVEAVRAAVPGAADSRLTVVLTDGSRIDGVVAGEPLYVRAGADGATVVASEPSDDGDGWEQVPDQSRVAVAPGTVGWVSL